MSSHADEAKADAKLDMTPMIDVVFLLIIFFLCIDFRTLEAKLPTYLPKACGVAKNDAPPQEQLPVKVVCDARGDEVPRGGGELLDADGVKRAYRLVGHRTHWEFGPVVVAELDDLVGRLEQVVKDPTRRVPDDERQGAMKLLPVVIEAGPDVTYGDVAATVDAALAAGFAEIRFGGGLGR